MLAACSERFFIHTRGEMGHVPSARKENQTNSRHHLCSEIGLAFYP
jgi:hypothetical protein